MSVGAGPLSLAAVASRFFRLGATAWGGPVVQIAALHEQFVERERLVDEDRFKKALAVCQALPGPEATELCIWLGTLLRGRLGGFVAGACFVLPGLVLMLLASWLLLERERWPDALAAVFVGMQAAVVALVVRAASRLVRVTAGDPWSRSVLVSAALGAIVGVPFAASLVAGGLVVAFARAGSTRHRTALVAATVFGWLAVGAVCHASAAGPATAGDATGMATLFDVFRSGLRAGALTFGGAYTAIPFLHADAVGAAGSSGWMTESQFLSGLAIGGVLPAPMVIVGTWVGWAGGGLAGALLLTLGIFLPAFVLPLLLHHRLENLVANARCHAFLDGVTAAVVGLVVAVAVAMLPTLDSPLRVGIAVVALSLLLVVRHRLAVIPVMALAALTGWLFA